MNDFTKEELQYFLAVMKPFHWMWQDDPLKLENKIQSMIDNYCEHKLECCHICECELVQLPFCNNDVPLMPAITKIKCKYCGKLNDN